MMVDTYDPPFGGYTAPTGPMTQGVQDEVIAEINKFLALIPDISAGADPAVPNVPSAHPDFDTIGAQQSDKIRAEMAGLIAAIDATPEA